MPTLQAKAKRMGINIHRKQRGSGRNRREAFIFSGSYGWRGGAAVGIKLSSRTTAGGARWHDCAHHPWRMLSPWGLHAAGRMALSLCIAVNKQAEASSESDAYLEEALKLKYLGAAQAT